MPTKIKIKIGSLELLGEMDETENAKAIMRKLPIEADINTWGEEFYFKIPVKRKLDQTATRVVNIGDIAFWPPDDALCIFFGPTPASNGPEPVPASKVNIVGRILDDVRVLRKVMKEKRIRIEKVSGK